MALPLVPLALAGAGLFLLSSGKKPRKGGPSRATAYKAPPLGKVPQVYGGTAPSAPKDVGAWFERQEALKALSQVVFNTNTGTVDLCSKCDPGNVDGKPGPKTRGAVKAFQALAGLQATGEWGDVEQAAMRRIFTSLEAGLPIECDPLLGYPAPFACFVVDDGYGLMPATPTEKPEPAPSGGGDAPPEYGPDDLLVMDAECNWVLHQDIRFFDEQKLRVIESALEGDFSPEAASEITEAMLAEYAPLCLSLGINGVGEGVRDWWNVNMESIIGSLKNYEELPEFLEEDAIEHGLL